MEHDDRIVKTVERGVHIPLTCKNHPNLRWFTKNIGGIGSRSIFFDGAIGADGKIDRRKAMTPELDLLQYRNPPTPRCFEDGAVQDMGNWIAEQLAAGYVFECRCSCRDLVPVAEYDPA